MSPRKIWISVIVLAIILFLGIALAFYLLVFKKEKGPQTNQNSTTAENWIKNSQIVFRNVTSTSTIKLDGGTFRMYLLQNGKIVYADSKDATTFSEPISTGIDENPGKFNSNPAVIKITDGNWIMVYEEQPQLPKGAEKGPGPGAQRNLLLATSADGKSFTKVGIVIDSAKDDKYFASVPNLIKTPDGKIRMYYVCGGEEICSAISPDGKAWQKEPGVRMADKAVDPDVLYRDGKWVMYFATLEGSGNKFYKATSSDGLKWQRGNVVLRPKSDQGSIVDPDVVELSLAPATDSLRSDWRMFFGEMAEGEGQMGGQSQIDLYYADFSGNIFK